MSDVWDLPYLNPKAKERVGYPTQKPVLLLERIIEISTEIGDLVLDPFCGSGTTCVAAKLNDRRFIGIDKSADAIQITNERLANPIKTNSNLLKNGRQSYRNANEEALSVLKGLEYNIVQRNKGIDAILKQSFQGGPVLIKVQQSTESLEQAADLLEGAKNTKQAKKAILIQTQETVAIERLNLHGVTLLQSTALQVKTLLSNDHVKCKNLDLI